MGCFEKLVKSHFLANVSKELEMARQTLELMSHPLLPPTLIFDHKERKKIYKNIVADLGLISEISDTLDEMTPEEFEMIYYIQMPDTIFIYSLRKHQVDEAVTYNRHVNGDFPFHRSKHVVQGVTVYAALINTKFKFTPASVN